MEFSQELIMPRLVGENFGATCKKKKKCCKKYKKKGNSCKKCPKF